MAKPKQTKFYRVENDEMLDAVEEAMSSLESAMDALKGIRELDEFFQAIGDVWDDMKPVHDEYERIVGEEEAANQDALLAEYCRSVI